MYVVRKRTRNYLIRSILGFHLIAIFYMGFNSKEMRTHMLKMYNQFYRFGNVINLIPCYLQGMISGAMESAFWDSIIESTKQHDPNYDRVLQLIREMKEELCQVAPESWRQEIIELIDLDIIAQVVICFTYSANFSLTSQLK